MSHLFSVMVESILKGGVLWRRLVASVMLLLRYGVPQLAARQQNYISAKNKLLVYVLRRVTCVFEVPWAAQQQTLSFYS